MKRVSVGDLHSQTGAIVEEAEHGDVIVIERDGVPVAELHPISSRPKGFPPDRWKQLARFPRFADDSADIISEGRDR